MFNVKLKYKNHMFLANKRPLTTSKGLTYFLQFWIISKTSYFITENLWWLFFNYILFCLRRILESIHSKYKSLRWFVVLRIMGYHYRLILNDTKLHLTLEKHFEFFEPRQQKRFEKRDRCTTSILFVASYWILLTLTRTLGRQKFSLIFVTVKKEF